MERPAPDSSVEALAALVRNKRLAVLSGAGLSTESGIPDYRGPASAARRARPVSYREFVGDPRARERYWARSAIGWPRVYAARPNVGHLALARMEHAGALQGIITQNVDGLHQAAGSTQVLELHGSLGRAVCLSCGTVEARGVLQGRILGQNPGWAEGEFRSATALPDGDVTTEPPAGSFHVPACEACGGILKPDVVFFGESVPRSCVAAAFAMLEESQALLVTGSSLTVYSGFRFVRRSADDGKPVAIVNQGPTRGDALAALRLDAPLGKALSALADLLAVS